jgi:hypothetical protein
MGIKSLSLWVVRRILHRRRAGQAAKNILDLSTVKSGLLLYPASMGHGLLLDLPAIMLRLLRNALTVLLRMRRQR